MREQFKKKQETDFVEVQVKPKKGVKALKTDLTQYDTAHSVTN